MTPYELTGKTEYRKFYTARTIGLRKTAEIFNLSVSGTGK